jgi:succinyl-CoA synthetase alpha subunit
MSILINKASKVLVQGITGHEGLFHTGLMMAYGTNVVGGTSPGKGGEWVFDGKIPVFDSMKLAVEVTGADTSVVFVPAKAAADAIFEAANSGLKLIVCITEGVPIQDMIKITAFLEESNTRLIGPNCPGVLTPGEAKVGIIPGEIAVPGSIGLVSRSGTLTYEVLNALALKKIGVSTCVGIGGDPIIGTNFMDILQLFEDDPHTRACILIGEIGGSDEEKAANFISREMSKPVVAYIAGLSAPKGKRMGHAGAIIEGTTGTAESKIKALESAGVQLARFPEEIPELLKKIKI